MSRSFRCHRNFGGFCIIPPDELNQEQSRNLLACASPSSSSSTARAVLSKADFFPVQMGFISSHGFQNPLESSSLLHVSIRGAGT